MSEDDRNQPRQPRDLQGLLKFAMTATRSEDAPYESQYQEMDPERRRFLEEALKSMTIDVVEELEKAMNSLMNASTKTEEEQLISLNIVQDFIDQIDTANDFFKVGGFVVILPLLNSNYDSVRSGGAQLVAELAQNNPFCQQHLLELNILPKLIELISDPAEIVAASAMHAISCMIRHHDESLNEFIKQGGLECILGSLLTKHEKVHIKSSFLISTLSSISPKIRDDFIALNAIENLTALVKPIDGYDSHLERVLTAIQVLTESNEGTKRFVGEEPKIRTTLQQVIKLNTGKDECREIVEISEILMNKFQNDLQENTDR